MPNPCRKCGRETVHDERALNKKMINRGLTEFLCLTCMADYFRVSEAALKQKIQDFKDMGCTLF